MAVVTRVHKAHSLYHKKSIFSLLLKNDTYPRHYI